MISALPRESAVSYLQRFEGRKYAPLTFKIKCALEVYKSESAVRLYKRSETGSLIFLFFADAIVLSDEKEDFEEIGSYLSMLGINSIETNRDSGEQLLKFLDGYEFEYTCYSYRICEKTGDEPPYIKNQKISILAKGICEGFGISSFDDTYSDICLRVNKGHMDSYLREDLSCGCVMHKLGGERLISGFFVDKEKRGKGEGTKFMSALLESIEGKVGVIHREKLTSFYSFMGFKKSEELISIKRG